MPRGQGEGCFATAGARILYPIMPHPHKTLMIQSCRILQANCQEKVLSISIMISLVGGHEAGSEAADQPARD